MKNIFYFILFAFLSLIVTPAYAGSGDIFSVGPNDEFRVQDGGLQKWTSGWYSLDPMQGIHETWYDIPIASNSRVLTWQAVSTTTLLAGSSSYGLQANFTQSGVPRGLQVTLKYGTGTCVIVGTNTYGLRVTEILNLSSGVPSFTNHAFSLISSFTITAGLVSTLEANNHFAIGLSSAIGFSNNLSSATDVLVISENTTRLSTPTVSSAYDTVPFPSANGSNDYSVWYLLRKSVFAP